MASVLLVTPSNDIHAERQNWSSPHLGIWRIAGWLRNFNHTVQVWDTILDTKPPSGMFDVIGVSITHDTLPYDLAMMNMLYRKYMPRFFAVGGVEASTNYGQIFTHAPYCKIAVIGEGEEPMLDLANYVDRGITIPSPAISGTVIRNFNKVSKEEFTAFNFAMPFKDMRFGDHWNITQALRPNVTQKELHCVRLNTSTYCNRACRFCSVTHIHRMAAGEVIKPLTMNGWETRRLVQKLVSDVPNVKTVYFNDDSFTLYREKPETFFDNPPALDYHIQARVDEVDLALLNHMADGGCKRISFGVESIIPHILKDIGKGSRVEEVDRAVEWCVEADIEPIILMMLFCPSITMEDLKITYDKLKQWQERGILLSIMSYIRPYHGTWYFESGSHEILWETKGRIRQPKALLPDDPDVRAMWFEFEKRLALEEGKIEHHWKGQTSSVMIEILGQILRERGVI